MSVVSYSEEIAAKNSKSLPPINRPKSSSGEQYTLASNASVKYSLPPKNAVQSKDDFQLGIIDTWPAHSANQRPSNVHISLNRKNQLLVTNDLALGKPEITPKPKFLENLEKFLHRELKLLDCYNSQPSEARLQVFREVFEYLLEEFKTYKPILSSIKNEYEMMLALQREKIRELEPLKQMLVTLADQCDHKLMQYREEEKEELKMIREEKKRLLETISGLQNDKQTLLVQLDKLKNENELSYEKYRNEYDKRKLLISDLNDLRFQQEEARLAELKREKRDDDTAEDVSNDDPITLKIALRVCRKNLNDAMKRLTKMEADYGEVVPRRDYLALETVYNEIKEKSDAMEQAHTSLKSEFTTLKSYSKNLETKVKEMQQELEINHMNNTPRPDWERCNTLIDGANGDEKWRDLTTNKSSIQILDTLISELNGTNKKDFIGLGVGGDIPVYLKHEGKVKNLNLSKRDVTKLIRTIMNDRYQQKKESGQNDDFLDIKSWLIDYLKKKFPHEAYEHSYSLHDAFRKYAHEPIKYFEGILKGDIDEQIFFQERKCITTIMDQLKEFDTKDQSNGIVSKNVFREALKPFFKRKSADEINNLIRTAEEDSNLNEPNKIDYKTIFSEESEDSISNFLVMFKSYIKDERLTVANLIKENVDKQSMIGQADLKKAINIADPSVSDKNIDKIINWCFRGERVIDYSTLQQRIENTCLFTNSKK